MSVTNIESTTNEDSTQESTINENSMQDSDANATYHDVYSNIYDGTHSITTPTVTVSPKIFTLTMPQANTVTTLHVPKETELLKLALESNTYFADVDENSLNFVFSSINSKIILEDFYEIFNEMHLPDVLIDDTVQPISVLLDSLRGLEVVLPLDDVSIPLAGTDEILVDMETSTTIFEQTILPEYNFETNDSSILASLLFAEENSIGDNVSTDDFNIDVEEEELIIDKEIENNGNNTLEPDIELEEGYDALEDDDDDDDGLNTGGTEGVTPPELPEPTIPLLSAYTLTEDSDIGTPTRITPSTVFSYTAIAGELTPNLDGSLTIHGQLAQILSKLAPGQTLYIEVTLQNGSRYFLLVDANQSTELSMYGTTADADYFSGTMVYNSNGSYTLTAQNTWDFPLTRLIDTTQAKL